MSAVTIIPTEGTTLKNQNNYINKLFFIAFLAMIMLTPIATADVGVFDHEPNVQSFAPEYVQTSQTVQVNATINNSGPDPITEVRMYNVTEYTTFTDFSPLNTAGWTSNFNSDDDVFSSTVSYYKFLDASNGIQAGASETFSFTATSPESVDSETCEVQFVYTTSDVEEDGENNQVEFNVKVDDEAPSSTVIVQGPSFNNDQTLYVNTATNFSLEANDDLTCDSGVDRIEWVLYNSTMDEIASDTFEGSTGFGNFTSLVDGVEGEYTLEFFAVDNVGNEESVNSVSFTYDGTTPNHSGFNDLQDAENYYTPDGDETQYIALGDSWEWTCNDDGQFQSGVASVTVEYQNKQSENDSFTTYNTEEYEYDGESSVTVNVTPTNASSHKVLFTCTDQVGKTLTTGSEFNVDSEGPQFQTSVQDNVWFVGEFNDDDLVSLEGGYFNLSNVFDPVPVHASGVNTCEVEVRNDEGELDNNYGDGGIFFNVNTSEDFTFEFVRDSYHNVTVICDDNVNNENMQTVDLYVDGLEPNVSSFRNEDELLDNTANPVGINNTITVNATDNKVGVENITWGVEYNGPLENRSCANPAYDSNVANNTANDFEASFNWTDNTTGYYTLHYSATDSYGQTTTDTRCLVYDGTTPGGNETTPDKVVENETFYVTQNTDVSFECQTPSNFSTIEELSITVDWITGTNETVTETTERYCTDAFNESGNANFDENTGRCIIDEQTSITYNFQEDTQHLVEYQCVDTVENTFIGNYTYFVDTVPPTTESSIIGPQLESDVFTFLNGATLLNLEVLDWGPHLNDGTTYYEFRQVPNQQCVNNGIVEDYAWKGWYVNGYTTSNTSVDDGESSTNNRGNFEFTTRNGEDVLSLQIDNSGVAARTYQYQGMKLADIDELTYRTYNLNDADTATLQIEWARNWSNDSSYQGNLIYIPGTNGNVDVNGAAPQVGQFQTWNTTDGYWVTSDNSFAGTWDELLGNFSEAEVRRDFGRVGFKLGTQNSEAESGVQNVVLNGDESEFTDSEFVPGQNFQERVGPVSEYAGENIPTATEGCYVLDYYSVDTLNNTEFVNSEWYYVDNTAPTNMKTVGEPSVFAGELAEPICFDTTQTAPDTDLDSDVQIELSSVDREGDNVQMDFSTMDGVGDGPCANATQPGQCAYLQVQDMPQFAKDSAEAKGANLTQCATEYALILSNGNPADSDTTLSSGLGNTGCGNNPDGFSTNDCVDLKNYTPEQNTLFLGLSAEYPQYVGSSFTDWLQIDSDIVSVDVSINNWNASLVTELTSYGPGNLGVIQLAEVIANETVDLKVADSGDSILDSKLLGLPSDCYSNVTPQEDLQQPTQPEETEVCYNEKHFITSETEVTLSCVDEGDFSSGANTMFVGLSWAYEQNETLETQEDFAQTCEEELNGTYSEETQLCEINVEDGQDVTLTMPNESYHELVFSCEDNVGKTSDLREQLYAVDNTGPATTKEVHEPSVNWDGSDAQWYDGTNDNLDAETFCDEEGTCYEVTLMTPLSLTCEDPQPHPSGVSNVTFQVELDGFQTGEKSVENVTEYYCDEYNGTLSEDGLWCTVETGANGIEEFYFLELSEHKLQYYCGDNLGNVGETNEQLYKVHEGAFGVELTQKWNLVSVPYVLLNNSIDAVFGNLDNVTTVWAYQNGTWLYYDVITQQGTLETIEPGYGYWVQANDTDEFVIGGSLFQPAQTPPSVNVQAGWNLLGPYGLGEQRDDLTWRFNDLTPFDHNTLDEDFFYTGPDTSVYGQSAECALYGLADSVYNSQAGSVFGYYEEFQPTSWYNTADGTQFAEPTDEPVMFTGGGYWVNLQEEGSFAPTSWCGPFAGNTTQILS